MDAPMSLFPPLNPHRSREKTVDKYEEAAEKKDVTCDHCMTTHPRQNPSCCEQYNDANTQVAALTASLASMTKERDRANWRADSNFENYEYEKQQRVALQFELAELRKRMGEAETLLRGEQEGWDCGPGECDDHQCHFHIIQRFLASPPSPAPSCVHVAPSEPMHYLPCPKCGYCSPDIGHALPPAPVESKPCPHSTCTAMHDAKGFHRPAADTAKPSPEKP